MKRSKSREEVHIRAYHDAREGGASEADARKYAEEAAQNWEKRQKEDAKPCPW